MTAAGIGVGEVGLHHQHPRKGGDRLGRALERVERGGAVVERVDVVRPERERAFVAGERLGVAIEIRQRDPAVVPGLDVAGIGRKRAVIARERFRRTAKIAQQQTAIDQRADVARIDPERHVVSGERLVDAAKVVKRVGAVAHGIGVARIDRERLLEAHERFRVAAERTQRQPVIRMRGNRCAVHLERNADQANRVLRVVLLQLEDAKHMQRFEVAGLRPQHFAVEPLGIPQPALLVEFERELHGLRHGFTPFPLPADPDPSCFVIANWR